MKCVCRETVRLVQNAEQAGCSWITVHGRTVTQRNEPPNYDAIRLVKLLGRVQKLLVSPRV